MSTVSADLILITVALPENSAMKDIDRGIVCIIWDARGLLRMQTVRQVSLAMPDQAAGPLQSATHVLVVLKKVSALIFLNSQQAR